MPMQVVVLPHDLKWSTEFQRESLLIAGALGHLVTTVHHIGSTSIPGISAKPVIDVLVEVTAVEQVDSLNSALEHLGYEVMGEYGIPGRRYFRKDNSEGVRTHHVHMFETGSAEAMRHLTFRDFLIAHPEWARRYSELKQQLVKQHPDSIESYMDGKDALIKEINQQAVLWRDSQNT